MKYKFLSVLAILTIFGTAAIAQDKTPRNTKPTEMEKVKKLRNKKKIKVGDNLYNRGSYYNAIEVYEMVLAKKPNHTETQYKLGLTNYAIRDYAKASHWFNQVSSFDSLGYPLSQYYKAASLKREGKYEAAKTAFANFKKTKFKKETDEIKLLKQTIDKEIEGCDLALEIMNEKQRIKVQHLGPNVNNPMSDYAPRWHDGRLIYSALKSDTVIVMDTNVQNQSRYSRLYETKRSGNTWEMSRLLNVPFNSGDVHVGNGMYSADKKTFVFTRCEESPQLKMVCKIYASYNNGEPQLLGNGINQEDANSTHPYLATGADGQEVLYFSSDMQGGKGGMDIWYAIRNRNGEFGAPKNAGGIVNTAGNEITPYYDVKNKRLYFSSDALTNIGGFDIYYSEIQNNDFTTPVHAGYPLNSSVDDLFYVQAESDKKGFLVSNRPGGMSLKSPTCCDDILEFLPIEEFITVQGRIIDEETGNTITNEDCFMYVYRADNDSLIGTFPIAKDGTFNFKLKAGERYKMVNSCKKYQETVTEIDARNMQDGDVVTKDVKLKKKDLYDGKIMGIAYFDYMKFTLRKLSKETLDSLADFLNGREDIIIRIEGHTDQRGSLEYNQKLSEQRALEAYNYLTKRKKVPAYKVVWVGYGKTRPIEDCFKYKECPTSGLPDCPCHQNNRRTEFIFFQQVGSKK
jgi:outer membrane protein OmpA-like peptidoglycan-associated protein